MALPFILGLVIGGGVVYAYSNRDELKEQVKAKSKDLKAGLKGGQKALNKVKGRVQNLAKSLTADGTQSNKSTKGKRTTKVSKVVKSSAPKTTRRRRVVKKQGLVATEATLTPNSTN